MTSLIAHNLIQAATEEQLQEFIRSFRPERRLEVLPDFIGIVSTNKKDDIIKRNENKAFKYVYSGEFRRYEPIELPIAPFSALNYSKDKITTVTTYKIINYSTDDYSILSEIDINTLQLRFVRDILVFPDKYVVLSGKRIAIIGSKINTTIRNKAVHKYELKNTNAITVTFEHIIHNVLKASENSEYFFVFSDKIYLFSQESDNLEEITTFKSPTIKNAVSFEHEEKISLFILDIDGHMIKYDYDKISNKQTMYNEGRRVRCVVKIDENTLLINSSGLNLYTVFPFKQIMKSKKRIGVIRYPLSGYEVFISDKMRLYKDIYPLQIFGEKLRKVIPIQEPKDRTEITSIITKNIPIRWSISRPLIEIIARFI